jgi:hypothetical protein
MSAYQQFINESRASQHRLDQMREASTQRALRAMRMEQQSDRKKELTRQVGVTPRLSRLRLAWKSIIAHMAPSR